MPARLSVPPIFKTLYTNLESAKYSPQTTSFFLKRWFTSTHHRILLGYYLVLTLTVLSTSLFLTRTNLLGRLMDQRRSQISAAYHGFPSVPDKSSLRLTTSPNLYVLVTNPQGLLIGETADGLLFNQLPQATVSHRSAINLNKIISTRRLSSWGLIIPQPLSGSYSFQVSARSSGSYTLNIYLANRAGIEDKNYQETFTLNPNQNQRYTFDYYPGDPVTNSLLQLYPSLQ